MSTQAGNRWRGLRALWLAGLSLLVCDARLKAATPPAVAGAYEVKVKGSFTGKGVIAVGANSVSISLQVTNEAGATGQLVAANLKLTDGRFAGTGTVLGASMIICGRVDPADAKGPVRAASLQATFSTDANTGGRIVGTRQGGPK